MDHGGGSVSGPLPTRNLQVHPGGSQRGLRSASSSSPPSASPREPSAFAKAAPIPEEGEAPVARQEPEEAQEPREQRQRPQKEVRRGWFG